MKVLKLQSNALRQQILNESFIWRLVVHWGCTANHLGFARRGHEDNRAS